MSKKKLPKINLTVKEISDTLKDIKLDDLLPSKNKPSKTQYFGCEHCQDQGFVQVYGPGPNLPCPVCGPRY